MSGSVDDTEGEVGGGGFDFLRSRCAHEKMPPLPDLGGAGRSASSFEFDRDEGEGCVGNDLVECALLGSEYPENTADRGGGGLSRLFSDSDRTPRKAEVGGESRLLSMCGVTGGLLALNPSFSFEDDAPGGPE